MRPLWVPMAAMVALIVVSNVVVQYPINDWLTWAAFTFPLCFLVTDLTNRAFGPAAARRVVVVGFAYGAALSIYLAGWRIGLASGLAFLGGQLLDVWVFDRLRRQVWWRAPLVSTFLSSGVDTALFFGLAFAATGLPWVTWAVGDYGVKIVTALACLAPYRALMGWFSPNGTAATRSVAVD
ncbi:MAG: VUT family protein [Alphaproteobacteria bacterium]|nr:VUT family protein [Alphaproteobacteria bacterium]